MSAPRGSGLVSSDTSLSSTTTASSVNANGSVMATANIINQKADASRSLYQICIALKARLALVPGFEPYLNTLDPMEPVDSLWEMFRTGIPLVAIFNASQEGNPIMIDDKLSDQKKTKLAVFRFIKACLEDLKMEAGNCFVINDVLGNDTTGFVKVWHGSEISKFTVLTHDTN